jgi:hypothetical protein
MFTNIINPIAILISLATASGILVHDTKIDKAASVALSTPAIMASYDAPGKAISFNSDVHTHIERVSFSQTINTLNAHTPSVQPRTDDKKHLMQKHVPRGHHAFDNYNLPLV